MAKKSYNLTCLVITFNSRHFDMTSIERYIGQSTIALIYEVAYALRRVNECHSCVSVLLRSKIGSSKEIVGECKHEKLSFFQFISRAGTMTTER